MRRVVVVVAVTWASTIVTATLAILSGEWVAIVSSVTAAIMGAGWLVACRRWLEWRRIATAAVAELERRRDF